MDRSGAKDRAFIAETAYAVLRRKRLLERLAAWKQPGGKARRDALRDALSYFAEAAALGAEDEGGKAEAAAARASAALAEAGRQQQQRR